MSRTTREEDEELLRSFAANLIKESGQGRLDKVALPPPHPSLSLCFSLYLSLSLSISCRSIDLSVSTYMRNVCVCVYIHMCVYSYVMHVR